MKHVLQLPRFSTLFAANLKARDLWWPVISVLYSTGAANPTQAAQAHLEHQNPVCARYLRGVNSGQIESNPKQWAVVKQLGKLYNELAVYASKLDAYQEEAGNYQARYNARLSELKQLAADQDSTQKHAETGSQPTTHQPGPQAGWGGWFLGQLFNSSDQQEQLRDAAAEKRRRERQRAAELQAQVQKELGPPPQRPQQPRGLYISGNVGSGKTMIMDMFFSEVAAAPWDHKHLLPARRMHFNAAMIEVHQRLHKLDQAERQKRQAATSHRYDGGTISHHGDSGNSQQQHDYSNDQSLDHDEAAAHDDISGPQSRQQGIFKFWDEGVERQKQAKLAVLAIRRQLRLGVREKLEPRLARLGRVNPETLASANAKNMQAAAEGFLYDQQQQQQQQGGQAREGVQLKADDKLQPALLCFDEMQVSDVFSAIALKALTECLLQSGGVLVLTSNRKPHELPRHGLHEAMFEHFQSVMTSHCDVVELSTEEDYREAMLRRTTSQLLGHQALLPTPPYLHPLDAATQASMHRLWAAITGSSAASQAIVQVAFGRQLIVPEAVGGVARFDFTDLCAVPTGPADYMALARTYHTVILLNVPAMSMRVRDQARRFITLVDELYNARVRLLVTAAAPPHQLFSMCEGAEEAILDLEQLQFETAVEGSKLRRDLLAEGGVAPVAASLEQREAAVALLGGLEEKFAFKRAVSRLCEMQSEQYLMTWASLHNQQLDNHN